MLYTNLNQTAERRIVEGGSLLRLHTEHTSIIMTEYKPYYFICRVGGLDNYFTLFLSSSGSAAYLFHKLKAPLMSPEIGII